MKKIFDGSLLKLYVEKRRLPNNFIVKLEIIKHPGAVLIVPFITANKIILLRQYRPVVNSYIWELPAGTIDREESLICCAKRELREETSYTANEWKRVGYIFPAPGYTTEKIHIFKASKLCRVSACKEKDEIITTHEFSISKIKKMFFAGKIVDSKTISALKFTKVI